MLYSGTKAWSYLWNGYGVPNASSNSAKPCLVTSNRSSTSSADFSDGRHSSDNGYVPCGPSYASVTTWYGPATTAVMYVEIRSVGGNSQRASSSPFSPWYGVGSGVGAFEMTTQRAGAETVKVNGALRSGCSKVANTRRASGTSNCV